MYRVQKLRVVVYCDSDWAGDKVDRKSRSGWIVYLAGGAVAWQSKKQEVVALSSTEAEYYAIVEAVKEILWLIGLLKELKILFEGPFLFIDNDGARSIAQKPVHHQRTKHIEVKYHFIRNVFGDGIIIAFRCDTADNCADIFTKILGAIKFLGFVNVLVNNEPQERCNLARTKETCPSHRRRRLEFERRARLRIAIAQSSLESRNPFGVILKCIGCNHYVPYLKDRECWSFDCPNFHTWHALDIWECSSCHQEITTEADIPERNMQCKNEDCSNCYRSRRPVRRRRLPDFYHNYLI
jgi:hypothetical protein